uniref:glucan 1,3-beta-glucosidase n=1 Tax=Daphnia galeata TaxID=27404 RepID=A0A8J2WLW8_9CRUS|nr:unnamed protein product [Daphnia galeata]
MKFLAVFSLALVAMVTAEHIQYAIRAGQVPVRGVNLGGWLVVEHWINSKDPLWDGVPSTVFSGGEMQTMRYLGHEVGDARFQTHWDTFITEEDIANIARDSLNTVRVPVGWWILGYDSHDPSNQLEYKTFAPGGLYYLDRLVKEWAMKYNVAVLICIHAAKGSQNGNDHSSPPDPGQVYWSQYPENIDNTIEVARFLASRYRYTPSFLGVELLNEPTSVDVAKLKDYYIRAYDAIRKTGNDCILVTSPILWEQNPGTSSDWENFMPSPTYTNMWHDWHKYLIWGYEGQSADWIMTEGVALIAADIAKWTGAPLVMGEWCLAAPSSATFTDETLKQYANNYITMMEAMKGGWTMWTWKQEWGNPRPDGQGGWSMKDLINDCIIDPKLWDSSSTLCP